MTEDEKMEMKRFQPLSGETGHEEHRPHKRQRRWLKVVLWMGGGMLLIGVTVFSTLIIVGKINVGAEISKLVAPLGSVAKKEAVVTGDMSGYWAVFLTNGQVYFGKLENREGQYLRLTDVYYLRAQRRLQPPEEGEEEQAGQPRQEVQLIKLGNELHGPVDEIWFNRDNVLFMERMKTDSRVVKGIEQFKGQSK